MPVLCSGNNVYVDNDEEAPQTKAIAGEQKHWS